MYKADKIRNWIEGEISPYGWLTLVTISLPELMKNNPYFSAYYTASSSRYSEGELSILGYHMERLFNVRFPEHVLQGSFESDSGLPRINGISELVSGRNNNVKLGIS